MAGKPIEPSAACTYAQWAKALHNVTTASRRVEVTPKELKSTLPVLKHRMITSLSFNFEALKRDKTSEVLPRLTIITIFGVQLLRLKNEWI